VAPVHDLAAFNSVETMGLGFLFASLLILSVAAAGSIAVESGH
jgi:hypothetical protein